MPRQQDHRGGRRDPPVSAGSHQEDDDPEPILPQFKDQVHSTLRGATAIPAEAVVEDEPRRVLPGRPTEAIAAQFVPADPAPPANPPANPPAGLSGNQSGKNEPQQESRKAPVWMWPVTVIVGILIVTVGVTVGVVVTRNSGGGSEVASPQSQSMLNPTREPTAFPTDSPTKVPTKVPTLPPTRPPTLRPTPAPTRRPTPNPNPTQQPVATIPPVLHPANGVKCADVLTTEGRFGRVAQGLDLRPYTNGTLEWIGCITANSCEPDTFYCNHTTTSMRFGTTDTATANSLRVLLDPGNALGENADPSTTGCSTASIPNRLSNAPNTAADAELLCQALGYAFGTLVRVDDTTNTCPEASAVDGNPLNWSSDFLASPAGGGLEFECSL